MGLKNGIEVEKCWFQILAIVIASISALNNGIFFTWPSPFILKISKDKENYNITEEEASMFSVIPLISLMISCPIFSKLSDIFGRKNILLLTGIVDTIVWILTATGTSVYILYFSRLLVGISEGMLFASLPSYLGEIASPSIRGTWGNAFTIFFLLGQLLVTVVGSYFTVQQTALFFSPIPVAFLVLFWFMPESPYFFIMKGEHRLAEESLRRLKRKADVTPDFHQLSDDVKRQMSEQGRWGDLLKIDSDRRALAAGVFLKVSQILGGSQAFIMFTQYIFDKSVGSFSTEVSSMIFIGLNVFLNLLACFAMEWLGRKKAYMASLIPCGIVLFIESIYFYIYQWRPDLDISSYNWIPLTGMVLYAVFSSYGIGPIPTLMLGELFSTGFRAKAMSVVMFTTGVTSFGVNAIFYFLSSKLGLYAPFLLFACCNVISAIISNFMLPETKGKTLEEIQQSMKEYKSVRVKEGDKLLAGDV
ncbi:hypothetical protein JTB14_025749 [Gonioctena quinquepunctata]|nr:hypothetical protein JTB14_025749 [Gonioctena quinquepunctata]